ncbi:MAG TPA: hypothetical protein VGR66_11770 [Candidatus Eisenbacteria bacterium]|jgi:hypothetical protein|nr:hypothetical protein [Candidatus Eisenbacteria bacterium]
MSEKVRPGREQAHVVVAAVRVLAHRESRPPSVQEVADLLGERPEPVNVVLRELTDLGILREVTDAYGARYEVGDHLLIEDLAAGSGPAMKSELASFTEKRRERDDALRKQFEGDLKGQRERKFSKLEEDLKNFRGGSGPRTNLWGEPVKDEDDED